MGDNMGVADNKLKFFYSYSIFFMFVVYISGMAGISIFSGTEALQNPPTGLDLLNPFVSIPFFFNFLLISTEYQILFVILIIPFIIGTIYAILEWARGV